MTPETGASEVRSHRAAVTRTGSAYPRRKVGAACQVSYSVFGITDFH